MTVDHDDRDIDTGEPIEELKTFAVQPEEGLLGRVKRSINRRTLAADTVDFSVVVVFQSLWELLRNVFEAIPNKDENNGEGGDGR